jgi:hypothetical protein
MRTQSVATVDPFGEEHEQYSICDSPDCLQKLEELTIGDGGDAPVEKGQKNQ